MNFIMTDGLPIVTIVVEFQGKRKVLHDVLVDTGCSTTIFDTDLMEEIGLKLDIENAITRKMYGIGGSELCIEQTISNLKVDSFELSHFTIQLGDMIDKHGFSGIIGCDFFKINNLVIDFELMDIYNRKLS